MVISRIEILQVFSQHKRKTGRPLQHSISYILILTGTIALFLAFAAFIAYDSLSYRQDLTQHSTTITLVAAKNSQQALSNQDLSSANNIMNSLANFHFIRYAAIIDNEGEIFSEFYNNWDRAVVPRTITLGTIVRDNLIESSHPIFVNNNKIGDVYVLSDLDRLATRQLNIIFIGLVIFAIALVVTIPIVHRKTRIILKPIVNLITLVTDITKNKNFSLRASSSDISELNYLVEGVNGMLEEISQVEDALLKSEERLSLALLGGSEGIWDLDIAKQEIYLDKYSCNILALDQDEALVPFEQWQQIIHPDDLKRVKQYSKQYISDPVGSYYVEFRVVCDNSWLRLKLCGKITQLSSKAIPLRMTGTLQDITKANLAEEQVKLYASVFDNTSDAIAILDQQFNVIATNLAFKEITNYSSAEIDNKKLAVLQDISLLEEIEKQLIKTGQWCGEINDQRKNSNDYIFELALNTVKHTEQQPYSYVVAVFSDITERKKNEDELYLMANFDPLTKLPNRAMFHDYFAKTLKKAKRKHQQLALLFIDLDKFKHVNDTLGHGAGDTVLTLAAQRMQLHLRETDFIARLSGDEFTIILEDISDQRQAEVVARKIQQDFQQEFSLDNATAHIGTSIGISTYPNDGTTPDQLLKQADTAMYHAKSNGRNSFHFFNKAMNIQAERRNLIEHELHKALEKNQITIDYQPKINPYSYKILGFEALARWHHATLGTISPIEFIAVAEEAGLIKELGRYIFKSACLQLKTWHQLGYSELEVAINVSAREFQLSDYPLEMAAIIEQTGVNPKFIELELTESIVMDRPEQTALMLDVIKNLGVTLSIDDFGTGYSSLSYLRRLPVDILKVDQSFVRELETDENTAAIAKAIVSMAHNLKLKVVAEGVETIEQLEFFKQLKCEIIQGYYFSPPLSPENATLMLSSDWAIKFTG